MKTEKAIREVIELAQDHGLTIQDCLDGVIAYMEDYAEIKGTLGRIKINNEIVKLKKVIEALNEVDLEEN